MKTHEVGDILWVVGKERPGVRVFRVVEEVTKKSLDGIITSYRVQAPSGDKKTIIPLEKIDGIIYDDSAAAQEAMNEKAAKAIRAMITHNQKLIDKFWSDEKPKKQKRKKGKLKPTEMKN